MDKRIHSFRPSSELKIDNRKSHVEEAKNHCFCRQCGQKGHWASNDQYPVRKKGQGGKKGRGKGKPVSSSHRGAVDFLALVDDISTSP